MAEEIGSLEVKLALESGRFDTGMKRVGTMIKSVDAEFRASAAEAAATGAQFDTLGNRNEMLSRKLNIQQSACVAYRNQLEELRKKTKSYETTQDELRQKVEAAKTAYKDAEKSLKAHEQAGDLTDEELKALAGTVETLKGEYEALNAQSAQVEKNLQKTKTQVDSTEKAYNEMRLQTAQTRQELNRTAEEIEKQGSKWTQLGQKAEATASGLKKAGDQLNTFGNRASVVVTAPIIAGLYKANEAALEFEDGLAKVGTIADETELSLSTIGDGLMRISDDTNTALSDMTEAEYQALSSGVKTGESIGFLEKSAKAAKAGFTDLTTAVNGSTNVLNAWGLGAEYAEDVYNKMIKAQDVGKTDLGKIAANIGNVASTAAGLNVSIDEILAAMATLTQGGIETSSAFSMLNQVLANVLKPTADAKKQAQALGLEFDATAIKSKGLAGFLADVEAKAGGNEAAIARLFGSVEAYKAVAALAGTQSVTFASNLEEIKNSAGALDKNFEKVSNTSGEKLRRTLNKLTNTATKFGETMLPTVDKLLDTVDGLVDSLANMDEATRNNVLLGAGALAMVGPTSKALGMVSNGLSGIAGLVGKIGKAGGLGAVLGGLSPVGMALGMVAATAAVGGLVYHLIEANSESTKIREQLESITLGLDDSARAEFNSEVERLTVANKKIIEIEAKVDGEQQNIADTLEDMLTDGKFSKKEENKLRKEINAWVDDAIEGVKTDMAAKADELSTALDGLGISEEEKQRIADGAEARGQETISTLEGYRDELNQLVADARTSTEGWTADKIARYNELLELIGTMKTELEITSAGLSKEYEARMAVLSSGKGTPEMAASTMQMGFEVEANWKASEEKTRALAVQAAKETYDQVKQAFDEGSASQETLDIALENMQIAIANQDGLEAEYAQRVQDVLNGGIDMALQNVEGGDERLKKLFEDYMNLGYLQENMQTSLNTTDEAKQKYANVLNEVLGLTFSKDAYKADDVTIEAGGMEAYKKAVDKVRENLLNELNTGDFDFVSEMLKSAVENGSIDDVDAAGMSESVKGLFGAVDMTAEGATISKELWAGMAANAATDSQESKDKIGAEQTSIIELIRTLWDINSPSGVMKDIFKFVMMGASAGVTENQGLLTQPFQNMIDVEFPQYGEGIMDALKAGVERGRSRFVDAVKECVRQAIISAQAQANTGIKIPVKLDYEDENTKKYSQKLGL